MSRHRAVRNIALNDIYIEEDDYVDDQEFLDELEGATDEQKAQLESGVEALREKLEKKFIINDNEIKKALWDTYFDEAEAMKWLKKTLKPKTTKSKGEMDIQDGEDEDSELEAGDSGKRSDAKPLGSKGTFGSLKSLSMMTNGMSSLSIGPKLGTTLLSPKSNQSEHIPKSSAIQGKGIGPLSKGGKPLASLSSLASKGNNTSGPSLGSLSNTSKTSKPLNTSLTRNASEKPVSLSTLAGSQVNKTATVDSSGNHINNALRALRSKSTVSQHTQIEGSIAMSIPLSRGTLPEFTKVRKPASVYPKVHHKSNTIELDIDPAAPPSLFADFIFSSLYGNQVLGHKQDSITSANWLSMLLSQQQPPTDPSAVLNSQNQHENEYCFNRNNYRNDCGTYPNLSFLRAVGNSGASTPKGSKGAKPQGQKAKSAVKPFGFDKPSPDDVVIAAQQRADHKDGAGGAGKTKADSQDPVSTQASSVAGDIDYVPEPAQKGKPKRRDISITDRTNLIVIGHVDAGKSTMMGHFLYKLADVDHRTMAKYKRDSEKIGKGSFSYAWVLDETDEERERGVTIDVATRSFETTNKKFTLLDAPGHRDFVPNMISGAAQADAAVLVIDAGTGGFESGFDGQGQTREHAILIRSLGVRQLIVAINKMDMVGWSEERYNEIVSRLTEFLSSVGFASDSVKYVPVSGLEGINLTKSTKDDEPIAPQTWYRRGPVLEELLDSLASPERNIDKPFRLPVIEFFRGGTYTSGRSGKIVTVHGRIVQGKVAIGDRLVLIPGNEKAIVKAIEAVSEDVDYAVDGENVYLTIDGIDIQQMSIGSVLCKPNFPVQYSDRFIAQIVVFEAPVPITNGFPVILHIQSDNKPAYVSKLISVIDQSTGEVKKSKPRHIGQGVTANVEIKVESSVCIDLFRESKDLGRIALRSGGITLAAGIITGVI